MKISRRALAGMALAGAASAQAPSPVPDELEQARQQAARRAETLRTYEVSMAAEPAFQFKA